VFDKKNLLNNFQCAMHFMTSTTVDEWERGDENSVCNVLQNFRTFNYNRAPRSIDENEDPFAPEILSEEEGTDG
jgi:hypothetical protein